MATNPRDDTVPVYEMTLEEQRDQFEWRVREWMGISAEVFLRRLDACEYDEIYDKTSHPLGLKVVELDMMRLGGSSSNVTLGFPRSSVWPEAVD